MLRKGLKIALVGCGAVTEHRHLPALARRDDCEVVALVDHDERRAKRLSTHFRVSRILTDYRDLLNCSVDAAIIALPNHLHAPASVELLKAGIHVLVEKPMALSVAECDRMLHAAEEGHAVLAVGLVRRFLHAGQFTKWAVESGLLGRVFSFHFQDGFIFNWPLASNFFFHRELAGGGVLMDTGVHTLDQLFWWLGDINSFEYYDDSCGGVEAECELHVILKSGAEGIVELSRTRNLRNTAIIRGERAELEVGLWRNSLSLRFLGSPVQVIGQGALWEQSATVEQSQIDLVAAEHNDLLEAIHAGRPLTVSGTEARRSIALIEACYKERRQLQLPWMRVQPTLLAEAGQ
jgi:predicted dehydrogenase